MNTQPLPTTQSSVQDRTVLTKAEVCFRANMKPRTLETKVRAGTFPPPVRLGKSVFWSLKSYENWHSRTFGSQESWPHASIEQTTVHKRNRRRG